MLGLKANLAFSLESQPVLRDVSLPIRSGGKITVCGPSDRQTYLIQQAMILGLLNLIESQQGILRSVGCMSTVTSSTLRSQINVDLQDACYMPGIFKIQSGLWRTSNIRLT